jgi:hypothetical protein
MAAPKENDDEHGQNGLESLAAKHVKRWGKPQRDDYDFRSWTKDASKELLKAGCIYEYTRESRKLRCLLLLISAARKRKNLKSCSFEGLLENDMRDGLGGTLHWLAGFADHLANNRSFVELLSMGRAEVSRSLAERPLNFPRDRLQCLQRLHDARWCPFLVAG